MRYLKQQWKQMLFCVYIDILNMLYANCLYVSVYPSWLRSCYFGQRWKSGPCLSWLAVSHWFSRCHLYPSLSCRFWSFRWEHLLCRSTKEKRRIYSNWLHPFSQIHAIRPVLDSYGRRFQTHVYRVNSQCFHLVSSLLCYSQKLLWV